MRPRQALGFAIFCLASASRWLIDEAFPSTLPSLEAESLHLLIIAFTAFALMLSLRQAFPQTWPKLAAASLLLPAIPSFVQASAQSLSSATQVALFTAIPLFVVVGAAASSTASRARMAPALAGLAGACLLLPLQLPATGHALLLFSLLLLAVASTAAGSLWLHVLLEGVAIIPAIAILSACSALVLGAAAMLNTPAQLPLPVLLRELLRCLARDLPLLFLLVWLLREVAPVRLATRFLVIPLITVMEGVAFLHMRLDTRMAAGLLLLAGGSALLLRKPPAGHGDAPTSLRLNNER